MCQNHVAIQNEGRIDFFPLSNCIGSNHECMLLDYRDIFGKGKSAIYKASPNIRSCVLYFKPSL
jgi:hypothetical protein